MTRRSEFVHERRKRAWAHGRHVRDGLLADFRRKYGHEPPAPALIVDELITDFLHCGLEFLPLPLNLQAETECSGDCPRVTVNSLMSLIPGVRDGPGVEKVAMWHEVFHIVDDLDALRTPASSALPGFSDPPRIRCYRSGGLGRTQEVLAREFWAEEAGRAAAVSHEALADSGAFRELCELAARSQGAIAQAWPLLYRAAADIGVNITALTRQLSLEGRISLQGPGGREVHVQPALLRLAEV